MTATDTLVPPASLADAIARRRSVRKLVDGPLPGDALARLAAAVEHAPASMGIPPWEVVFLRERRAAFWDLVECAFRERLEGDQLERYLGRLAGFREAALVALVFEDAQANERLLATGYLTEPVARDFAVQALGIVQMALWLTAADLGLAASLQHWDAQIAEPLEGFVGLPRSRYRLVAVMPIGHAAEQPGAKDPEPWRRWSVDPVPVS